MGGTGAADSADPVDLNAICPYRQPQAWRTVPGVRFPRLPHLLLAAALALPPLAAQAADPLPADPMARRMLACVACHGQDGRATNQGYFPRIAGKPAGYLFNQLLHFRDGRRINATMTHLVEHMSDAYLRDIAGYFAGLDLPYPAPQTTGAPPAVLARGEQLVRVGDAALGVPACAACHGAAMTGIQPAMPGLLGLPRDYLLGQFGAWRNGLRKASAPDCMGEIARRLSPDDVSAMAVWLSSQPVTGGPAPASAAPDPWPMRCGSAEVLK